MMETLDVALPIGFAIKNKWYKNARLRPLTGTDEEAIREIARFQLPVERITTLLTRCLMNLGPKSPIDFDDVRALTVGDRDALLLHLRCLTYGDKIQSVLTCPNSKCREKMDVDLTIGDILVSPNRIARRTYETVISANGTTYEVKFRLPTGADQEAIAELARHDSNAASTSLLQRCIKEIRRNGTKVESKNNLPFAMAELLSKRMAELDPQADISLNLHCPACKQSFLASFDIGDYFFQELIANSRQLYREVHVLALHYHWSEKEILNMSRSKRQVYLKFLSDTSYPKEV
jgi:hypothetical protein